MQMQLQMQKQMQLQMQRQLQQQTQIPCGDDKQKAKTDAGSSLRSKWRAKSKSWGRRYTGAMGLRMGKTPKPALEYPALLEFAVRSLSSKMKSERDLRRRLEDRAEKSDEGKDAVERVIAKLKDLGYLSDERFAADFTRLRKENEKYGKRRVQQGLMQKGIPQELTNATLTTAYEDVDEVALAKEYVARKRMKKPEGEKEVARAMRRLVGAGFSVGTVWKVLRGWGAEVEEVDLE
jgi:regulatory protein